MHAFLSVGRPTTPEQKLFLDRLNKKLAIKGFLSRTAGQTSFTAERPLDLIKAEMQASNGIVALASERVRFQIGQQHTKLGETLADVAERRYATPWNQIELGMATMLGLPMLVLREQGVFPEGLLEDKHGNYVFETTLSCSELDSDEFTGILDDWCRRAQAYRPVKEPRWRRHIVAIAFLVGGSLLGIALHAPAMTVVARFSQPKESKAAERAADTFLKALDSGEPTHSWELLAELGKAQVGDSVSRWVELYRNNVQPLGKTTSRKLIGQASPDSIPGLPAGNYKVFTYLSHHDKESAGRQENVLVREKEGEWAVANYQISVPIP